MRFDRANFRANLYALALAAVALAVGAGWLTTTEGAVIGALAAQTITLVFALYWAYKTAAPVTRQVIYAFLGAVAAVFTTWGFMGAELAELTVGVIMSAVGMFIVQSKTDEPSDQT